MKIFTVVPRERSRLDLLDGEEGLSNSSKI